jgi:hypothetical protein
VRAGGAWLVLGAALALGPQAATEERRPVAGGRLAAVSGGDLDLVGDLWVDLPLPPRSTHAFFALDTRTVIERAHSQLTFEVRDLQYDMRLGWRERLARLHLVGALGQRGRERVDADGQGFVQYAGLGLELPYPERPGRPGGRIFVGGVVDEREVEADLVVQGAAHVTLARSGGGAARFGLDVEIDGLVASSRLLADVVAGPSLRFRVASDRSASFFVHRQQSRHPLGLEQDVWLAGFTYEEGPSSEPGTGGGTAPEIDGGVVAGGGAGRIAGRLALRMLSPPFARDYRAVFLVDGNVLTAEDTGELYYRYDVGLERAAARAVLGGYFHHRSNHQLAEPNAVVTSLNVLEAGVETRDHRRPAGALDPRARGLRPALDGFARVGALLDSSFGEDTGWHVRGGARLAWSSLPLRPFLTAAGEAGDVAGESYGVGIAPWAAIELGLEHLRDEQFFGRDRTAWLLTVRYGL